MPVRMFPARRFAPSAALKMSTAIVALLCGTGTGREAWAQISCDYSANPVSTNCYVGASGGSNDLSHNTATSSMNNGDLVVSNFTVVNPQVNGSVEVSYNGVPNNTGGPITFNNQTPIIGGVSLTSNGNGGMAGGAITFNAETGSSVTMSGPSSSPPAVVSAVSMAGAVKGGTTTGNGGAIAYNGGKETVTAQGGNIWGVFLNSTGSAQQQSTDIAGNGGSVVAKIGGVTTTGDLSTGVVAQSQGGASVPQKGNAQGGNGGWVQLTIAKSVQTTGMDSIGVVAQSIGGNGGIWTKDKQSFGGGGAGGDVIVVNNGTITTNVATNFPSETVATYTLEYGSLPTGYQCPTSGSSTSACTRQDPGNPGNYYYYQTAFQTISATAQYAHGIVAQSIGGSGGIGTATSPVGFNANSQSMGVVTVTNTGTITTAGDDSHAIVAQSVAGGGGIVSYSSGPVPTTGATAPPDAQGMSGGAVNVAHTAGSIATSGEVSYGILAQSIAGGGGSGGSAKVSGRVGGDGDKNGLTGGGGGPVTVQVGGAGTGVVSIGTTGFNSIGILAQSIGGGGGDGGHSKAYGTAVGGNGGPGGGGGAVTLALASNASLTTAGTEAFGVILQSIGGGGGHGGYAKTGGAQVAVAVGGSGGGGGNGGTVSFTNDGAIATSGDQASAVLAQSVGGGGGAGGSAQASSFGLFFSVAVAVGGSGGNGGDGGNLCNGACATAPLVNNGKITTLGDDAVGVELQSIGGGGGRGGSSAANAVSVGLVFSASVASSVGGSGGGGGSGGAISFANNATISTSGSQATALVAQSIGGGGGNGGDARALAVAIAAGIPDVAPGVTVAASVAIGGSGGNGGQGGAVSIANNGTLQTSGTYSMGIEAQSVGGGGGHGGDGDATSVAYVPVGEKVSLNFTLAVGGSGGKGGDAGTVAVTNSGTITTAQKHGDAIFAQSVGGGGGYGGGGTADGFFGDYTLSVNVGGSGGTAGNGAMVTVTNTASGVIQTQGVNANGIFAQSVGGGGGVGGSAGDQGGSLAPPNQPLLPPPHGGAGSDYDVGYTLTVNVGGAGGAGGNGAAVNVTNAGKITTSGSQADAIFAQSVGGGGGKGGAGFSVSAPSFGDDIMAVQSVDVGGTIGIGGAGGKGGTGGAVTVSNSGALQTAGYRANGVFAQSVGGGGGVGGIGGVSAGLPHIGIGSFSAVLGFTSQATPGNAKDGGSVTATNSGTITTAQDHSYGILAQSIGGGGGVMFADAQGFDVANAVTLHLPQGGGVGYTGLVLGNGGPVSVTHTGAITTSGANAFGILVQSVGNGGGLAAMDDSVMKVNISDLLGPSSADGVASGGNGGAINVTLGTASAPALITTNGDGAVGVMAQSLGGGGGLFGAMSSLIVNTAINQLSAILGAANPTAPYFTGGDIVIKANAQILTYGAAAHGIFAQSLAGGGGGIVATANPSNALVGAVGISSLPFVSPPLGGNITITQNGSIITQGNNAIGIYAQSNGGAIAITVNGDVHGGAGPYGRGVYVSNLGGPTSTVTINPGGLVVASSGTAFESVGAVNVINYGTASGSVALNAGDPKNTGTFVNHGTFNPGSTVAANFVNAGPSGGNGGPSGGNGAVGGTVVLGAAGKPGQTVSWSGPSFVDQGGTYVLGYDAVKGAHDSMVIASKTIDVKGAHILVNARSVLPGAVADIIQVPNAQAAQAITAGTAIGDAAGVIGYALSSSGATISMKAASAQFASAYANTNAVGRSIAQHLQGIWDSGASGDQLSYAGVFADLSNTTDRGAYAKAVDQLGSETARLAAIQHGFEAQRFTSGLMSCPAFEGKGTLLGESDCAWARVIGGHSVQSQGSGYNGYTHNQLSWQFGGQKEVADDWFLGGSMAYGNGWYQGNQGREKISTTTAAGGIALKRQMGPWQVSGALSLTYDWGGASRAISLPTGSWVATSNPESLVLNGRLRTFYEIPFESWYLKPSLEADVFHTRMPGFGEKGAGSYNLIYANSTDITWAFTPSVEVGARFDGEDGFIARTYLTAGAAFYTKTSFDTKARLQGLGSGVQMADVSYARPSVTGRLGVGVDLYDTGGFTFRAEYNAEFAQNYFGNTASLRGAFRF